MNRRSLPRRERIRRWGVELDLKRLHRSVEWCEVRKVHSIKCWSLYRLSSLPCRMPDRWNRARGSEAVELRGGRIRAGRWGRPICLEEPRTFLLPTLCCRFGLSALPLSAFSDTIWLLLLSQLLSPSPLTANCCTYPPPHPGYLASKFAVQCVPRVQPITTAAALSVIQAELGQRCQLAPRSDHELGDLIISSSPFEIFASSKEASSTSRSGPKSSGGTVS